MAKRPVPLYDFKAFGAAIKAARNEYGESRKKVSDELYISPRYLANIENKGQQPSLQVFYDLVTRYHISVDQFFFPNSNAEKSTGRRQLDALLDGMSDKGIRIVTATAREITEVEKAEDYLRRCPMKRFVKCFFELLTQILVKVRKCKVQRVCVLHFQLAGSGGCFFLMKLYH